MNEFLFDYQPVPATTWAYLSSLMMIALFFKFSRLWSVRNLDLACLILFAPGLLLVKYGQEQLGFSWLFGVSALFMVRLLVDPLMVRRPLLEPNLSVGGQTFTCVALFMFLMANVLTSKVTEQDLAGASMEQQLESPNAEEQAQGLAERGPGYPWLFLFPKITTQQLIRTNTPADGERLPGADQADQQMVDAATARTVAILSHLAVVLGLMLIGYRHFDNIKTGIAAATLYLMLPYTAMYTGRVLHVLPAALLIWSIVAYRRPLFSGMLMGLAIGAVYYPAFLLPLWLSFYWQRGLLRFLIGVATTVLLLAVSLWITAPDWASFGIYMKQMFGWRAPLMENLGGFWQFTDSIDPVYRIPVLAAFIALCGTMAIWPAQKNLGTLMSCSAAIMLGTQFWHAHGGGLYIAWYLPLLLLTIFRPNLEDRVALSVLGEGWRPSRRNRDPVEKAA